MVRGFLCSSHVAWVGVSIELFGDCGAWMCKLFRYLNHIYAISHCRLSPHLGPALTGAEHELPLGEKLRLIKADLLPL